MKIKTRNAVLAGMALVLSHSVSADALFVSAKQPALINEAKIAQLENQREGVRLAKLYAVNGKALVKNTKQLQLSFADINIFANQMRSEKSPSGGLAWVGSVATSKVGKSQFNKQNSVTLINRDGRITGSVWVDGRLFKIRPLKGGLHLVTEMDANINRPDHPEHTEMEHELKLDLERLDGRKFESQSLQTRMSTPVIRMAVFYTNKVTQEVSDIEGLIDLAITETNTGFSNSNVNARVELAYQTRIGYTSSSISTDLNRLKSSTDNYMHNAHSIRDSIGADVVMLLVPGNQGSCGKAAAIGASNSTAFAVTARDCATGYYSFGHELGHLLAARHNPEADSNNWPYAYGHGYQTPDEDYRTIMAYDCTSSCTRVNWWSNPDVDHDGQATGTASRHDNARVLDVRAPTVAGFKPTPAANAAVCQFDRSLSYVEEFYETVYGYDEGEWVYRWEGQTIARGDDPRGGVQAPNEVIHGGFRYYMSKHEKRETGGYNYDEYWQRDEYRICRVRQ